MEYVRSGFCSEVGELKVLLQLPKVGERLSLNKFGDYLQNHELIICYRCRFGLLQVRKDGLHSVEVGERFLCDSVVIKSYAEGDHYQ